jgi:VacB/RNase II family 3'-5' exoribonuclease
MNVDPIAQQTILNAVRQTQSSKVAQTEAPPQPPAGPLETLEQARTEEVGYKPNRELQNAQPQAPEPEAPKTQLEPEGVPLGHLHEVANEAMTSRGLGTEFSPAALQEVQKMGGPAPIDGPGVKDLRKLAWASIDNDDTKDIDQLAYAEDLGDGRTKLMVAVADVAAAIPKGSALDQQAQQNTVTVYTPGKIFPMLPEQLSTDWTSLGPDVDRRALVTEMIVDKDGNVESSQVYQAAVNNKAKLAYKGVSKWMEGEEAPENISKTPGMDDQIKLQMEVGQRLGEAAKRRGALEFEADRVSPVVENDHLVGLEQEKKNLASEAVANMMIATNTATAGFLQQKGYPVFQRVVESPERWDKMREVAVQAASHLPAGKEMPSEMAILPQQANPAALSNFLREFKQRDPQHYSDVSTGMLKLMGGGDYVVTPPGAPLKGHFGQGVMGGDVGYVHSTAPNRRLPDVIIQRLVKAASNNEACPYTMEELNSIAERCNTQESAAKGAERQVSKAAVAQFLTSQIGEQYEATVTGKNPKKGVFVKVSDPPIEGKLVEGLDGLDVGDKVKVELRRVDPTKGFIDFVGIQ